MNAEEFDEFYLTYYSTLCNQVFLMCGNRQEAEDCVQEAFGKAWLQRDKMDVKKAPQAWVRMTACNLAISSWRKWRRHNTALLDHDQAICESGQEQRMLLLKALDKLKPNFRRAIVLHYYADLSTADVASELGVSPETARTWLTRARKQLSSVLSEGESHV